MTNNPLIALIDIEASSIGFKKRGSCWYDRKFEVTHVVDFQKSRWGKCGYLNVGLSINDIAASPYPNIPNCHLQFRAETFMDDSERLDSVLDYEDYWKIEEEERRGVIRLALCSAKMYFFSKTNDINHLTKFVLSDLGYKNLLTGEAKHFLRL